MGMGLHVAAPPLMHTWERLRVPTLRPLPSHVRDAAVAITRAPVVTSAGIYSQQTHHEHVHIHMTHAGAFRRPLVARLAGVRG